MTDNNLPVPPDVTGMDTNPEATAGVRPTLQQTHEGETHNDYGGMDIPINHSTKIFALCAALNSCNLGFDIGVSTSVGKLVESDFNLTTVQREIFLGSLNLFAMFGAISSNYFSDRYGRRQTFIIAAIGFILGITIEALAPNYSVIMFGRLFVGLGVGVGMAIDPVYISEISPAKHRGYLVTWSEIAINLGIVLGFSMGLFFAGLSDGIQWRVMLSVGLIMPICMIYLVMNVMPESPRWLTSQGREPEAKVVLEQIYPPNFPVDEVISDIKESLERERIAERELGWHAILNPTPAFKRMLMVGLGVAIAQQAIGVDAMQYYLTDILDSSGVHNQRLQSLIMVFIGLVKLGFILVGGKFFDTRGRRPLMFTSLLGMAGALLLLSILYFASSNDNPSTALVVIFISIYMAFFSIGMGPGAWLIPSEIFATSIRAKAMSVATTLNRGTAFLMSSTFLSTKDTLSWGGFFLLMTIVCFIVLAYLFHFQPETKGRSLEDMSVYFAELTGDRSILDAEQKLRGEQEMTKIEQGKTAAAAASGDDHANGSTGAVPTMDDPHEEGGTFT